MSTAKDQMLFDMDMGQLIDRLYSIDLGEHEGNTYGVLHDLLIELKKLGPYRANEITAMELIVGYAERYYKADFGEPLTWDEE